MLQRRSLYRCVAGVEPNDLPQSDSGSEQWSWRNLPSSSEIASTPPIQPCNLNNIPLGMNLIPLDSWHRAQEPPGVGFRIDCLAVVECCSGGPGVWMLSVVMKRVSRRVQFEAKCRKTTRHYARLESIMAITRFQTGVSWHFHSFKDDVLKIEL